MFSKLKNTSPIIILFFGLFITKCTSFVQNLIVAYLYGTSSISDSLIVSLSLPNMIYAILSVSITQCYVPIYKKHYQNAKFDCNVYTTLLLGCTFVLGVILSFIIFISIPFILQLMLPYGSVPVIETTTLFMKFLSLVSIFVFFMGVLQGYFQAVKSYFIVGIISVPLNIGLILSLLLGKDNIVLIGTMMILAYLSQFLLFFFYSLKNGFKLKISGIDSYYIELIKSTVIMIFPLFIGGIINDFSSIIDKSFASMFEVGIISGMDYGYKVSGIIYSLISLPIMTIFYPNLSEYLATNDYRNGFIYLKETVFYTICLTIPIIAIVMIFGKEICTILFFHGSFSNESLQITVQSLMLYSVSIIPMLLRNFYEKVFYATSNTNIHMINTLIMLIINIIGNVVFSKLFGFRGLIISTIISFICSSVFFYILQHIKFKFNYSKNELMTYLKLFLVTLIDYFIYYLIYCFVSNYIPNSLFYYMLEILFLSIIYILIYLLSLRLFNILSFRKAISFFVKFK